VLLFLQFSERVISTSGSQSAAPQVAQSAAAPATQKDNEKGKGRAKTRFNV